MKEITISLNDKDMNEDELDDYIIKLRKLNQALFFYEWCQKKYPEVVQEYLDRYKDK